MREEWKRKREEGQRSVLTLALCLFLLSSILFGCGRPKKHSEDGKAKKDKPLPISSVGAGGGYTTVYQTAADNSPISFTLRWTEGGFDSANGTVETGHMVLPTGRIFQGGKPTSTYRSDTGDAKRDAKRLNMRGNVVLQSIDKAQTLRAPLGEYRGDVKLLRATGGVVATGTFGTLSGVPELWATPDLRLIGTPDMVSQKLKLSALVALAATTAVGKPLFQGKGFDLKNQGPQQIENLGAAGLRFTVSPAKGKSLLVTFSAQNMTVQSAGTVVILTDSKGTEVRHMTSQGAVNVVKTVPTGTTTMDGVGSVYDAAPGAETGTLDLGGRVTIVSESKGRDAKGKVTAQTTTSKGDKGHMVLVSKPKGNENAMRSATLDGNVTIDSKGADADTFNGVGDHLLYTPRGETADADLTGSVVLTSVSQVKDEKGNPATKTIVSRGRNAHTVIDPKAGQNADPLKSAILTGGTISINVTNPDGQTFKSTGDRLVYTALGEGRGRAVMTGDLTFSGDAPAYLSDIAGANNAVILLDKKSWQTVNLDNTEGTPTTTTITTKTPPVVKPAPVKKKKGGKP